MDEGNTMSTRAIQGVSLDDDLVRLTLRDFQAGLVSVYGSEAPDVVVYGSYARGEATEDSDLDLVLVFTRPVNPSEEIRQIVPLLADLNLRYGMLLSVLPVSREEYREGEGPFWRNVRREGVQLDGR